MESQDRKEGFRTRFEEKAGFEESDSGAVTCLSLKFWIVLALWVGKSESETEEIGIDKVIKGFRGG